MLRVKLSKQLKTKVLAGLPELAPEKYRIGLITEGIYSRIRHPRYVEALLALLAYALLSNYLAGYVVYLIVLLEEKELRDRFGTECQAYCARVPRFVPKL